ncbi:MAG: hypothetical protein ACK5LO_17220 [Leucobacter sp.]
MNGNLTRIDPSFPVCWEDPQTLRVGFERARARLRDPSAGTQRFVGTLLTGVDLGRLPQEVKRLGTTPREARSALQELRPVLVPSRASCEADSPGSQRPPRPMRAVICDGGRAVAGLYSALLATGVLSIVPRQSAIPEALPRLAIHVERFLEPRERAHRWLMESVPHLLIRFTDESVRIGPIVRSEGAPCHGCTVLTLIDRDPAYPTLAAQLHSTAPASESELGAHFAGAYAGAFVRSWLDGAPEVHTTQVVVPIASAFLSRPVAIERVEPHAECACTLEQQASNAVSEMAA